MRHGDPSSPPLTKSNAFPLRASCTASFLHVTFSRALRTAIIAGRPNTKVFYDVAYPDRGRGIPKGRTKTGETQKESHPVRGGKRGLRERKEKLTESGEKRQRAEREEVSVIKLRGNPKFHFQPIYAARDNATGARAHAGLFFLKSPLAIVVQARHYLPRFPRNEMIAIGWW